MNSSAPNFLPSDDELLRRESQWMELFKRLEMASDDFDESQSSNQEDENLSDAMSIQSSEDEKESFDMQQLVSEIQPVIDQRVADWPAKGVNLQLKKVDPKVTVEEWLRANAEWTSTEEKYKKTVVEENNKKITTTVKRTTKKSFRSFCFPKVRSYQNHTQHDKHVSLNQPDINHESCTEKTLDTTKQRTHQNVLRGEMEISADNLITTTSRLKKLEKPRNKVSSAKPIQPKEIKKIDSKNVKSAMSLQTEITTDSVQTSDVQNKQENSETATNCQMQQNVRQQAIENSNEVSTNMKKPVEPNNNVSSVKPIRLKKIENKLRKIEESTMLRNGEKTFDTTATLDKQSEEVNREIAEKSQTQVIVENSSVITEKPEKREKLEKSAKQIELREKQKPRRKRGKHRKPLSNDAIIVAIAAVDEMLGKMKNREIATKPPIQANVIQNIVENASRSSVDINATGSQRSSKSLNTTDKTRRIGKQIGKSKIPSKTKVSIEVVVDEMHRLGSSEIAKQSEIQPTVDRQTHEVNSKSKKQLQSDTVQKASTSAESNKLDGSIDTMELPFQTSIIESNQNLKFISSPNRKAGTKKEIDRTQKESNNRNYIQLQQKNSFEGTSQSVYTLSQGQNTMLEDNSSCDSEEDDVLIRCYKNKNYFWKIE